KEPSPVRPPPLELGQRPVSLYHDAGQLVAQDVEFEFVRLLACGEAQQPHTLRIPDRTNLDPVVSWREPCVSEPTRRVGRSGARGAHEQHRGAFDRGAGFPVDEAAGEAGGLLLSRGPPRTRERCRETQHTRDPPTKHGYALPRCKRTRRRERW